MAKQKNDAKGAEPTKAMVQQNTGISERPDWLSEGDRSGTEHIGRGDIAMPRLAIAQQMSPQLVRTEASYIPSLELGDMFDTLSTRIYGPGPLNFAIVRAFKPRGVEFIPRAQGGGVKDPNVPLTDPRMLWSPNGDKPLATLFYDYLIMLLPRDEDDTNAVEEPSMIALSFKSTGIRVAKQLNGQIVFRKAPVWAGKYTISTTLTKNKEGSFYIPVVKNDGWIPQEMSENMQGLHAEFADKEVNIDRGDGTEATDVATEM